MQKLKQIISVFALIIILTSCSSSSSGETSVPTLQGKWAFGPDTGCGGRNAIEFKNTNLFIEYHYGGDCILTPYDGIYTRTGDIVTINGTENVIVELTITTLVLHQTNNDAIKTYDRIN